MIATSEQFMERMGWSGHQVLIVAHNDKPHAHVHLMINRVHPETGIALSESYERLNASNWAKQYEIEQRRIFCTERLKPEPERETSPTRDKWQMMKDDQPVIEPQAKPRRAVDTVTILQSSADLSPEAFEWRLLKNRQRHEREDYFAENKEAFRDIRRGAYEDTKLEFAQDWRDYFKARRDAVDPEILTAMKADIVQRQTEWFEFKKEWGYAIYRDQREFYYECLLEKQQAERGTLKEAQSRGVRSDWLMEKGWGEINQASRAAFEEARPVLEAERLSEERRAYRRYVEQLAEEREAANPEKDGPIQADGAANDNSMPGAQPGWSEHQNGPKVKDGLDMATDAAASAALGVASLAESLFDGFLGGGSKRPPADPPRAAVQSPEFPPENPFTRFAEEQKAASEKRAKEEHDQRYWDDRERRRE